MSIIYHDGYLHTNSAYFSSASIVATNNNVLSKLQDIENINADYTDAINYAESREISFYQTFFSGITTYEAFIEKLREVFDQADRAGAKIKQLSNASLKSHIQTVKNAEEKVDFKIIVNSSALSNMGIKIPSIKTEMINYEGDVFYLTLDSEGEIKIIKEIANHIKRSTSNSKQFNNFDPSSDNTEAISKWLNNQLPDIEGEVTKDFMEGLTLVKNSPKNSGKKEGHVTKTFKIGQFPFKWTKKQIAEYRKTGDKSFEAEFAKAKQTVYNFLKSQLQIGSEDDLLNAAFKESWKAINAKGADDYFFEGDNLIKAVLGNMGEFQLDLMINYATMAIRKYNNKLGKIVGDIVRDGRGQGRTDYQLMVMVGADIGSGSNEESIGIQVKNIDKKRYHKVEVNSDLGLIAPNLGSNITTSVANYQFNESIANKVGNMEEVLESYVESYIWRALNFNVNSGLQPEHTNTFYWLGGDKIIPVSKIIRKLYDPTGMNTTMEKPTTEIDLKKGSKSDMDFTKGNPPEFTTYWLHYKTGWKPQSENSAAYDLFISNIRVKSVLNLASFIEVSGGSGAFEVFN